MQYKTVLAIRISFSQVKPFDEVFHDLVVKQRRLRITPGENSTKIYSVAWRIQFVSTSWELCLHSKLMDTLYLFLLNFFVELISLWKGWVASEVSRAGQGKPNMVCDDAYKNGLNLSEVSNLQNVKIDFDRFDLSLIIY